MNNSELIADKIEAVIGVMFSAFNDFHPKPTEYAIFFNPARHSHWFILIFFNDSPALTTAIQEGVAYQVHQFLNDRMNQIDELATLDRTIFFDFGNYPENEEAYNEKYFELLHKMEKLQATAGEKPEGACAQCGHDFDAHQLRGPIDESIGAPREGWIMCPEEGCHCFQTWSVNFEAPEV